MKNDRGHVLDNETLYSFRQHLDGEVVMVNPGRSREKPAVGMRGSIQVTRDGSVDIVLQFAVMFDRPAATRTIHLTDAEVSRLLASRTNGEYSITLDRDIAPPPPVGYVVASPRL